jgi:hypothetical protein
MRAHWREFVLAGLVAAALPMAPAVAESEQPLARLEDPICPGVAGMQVAAAEAMVGRIRQNAERLGVRMADETSCAPNVIVAFVDDGRAFLERMKNDSGHIFAELSNEDRDRMMSEAGPAHVFTRVRSRTRDGLTIARRENLSDIPQTEMWSAHSKIYTATRNDIDSVLVLIDRGALQGLSLNQLADYATFRALSQVGPQGSVPGESILSLFAAGPARPAGMTDLDRAFLQELYSGIPNMPADARLAELENATGRPVVPN